jgi:hypothetical protein
MAVKLNQRVVGVTPAQLKLSFWQRIKVWLRRRG